jgi:sugar lactone lactonase YvrE
MTVRPQGIAVDQSGNILIADTPGNQILRIDASGKMTIFAGRGTRGFSGDGGPAVSAELSSPSAVAVDSSGAVFVADSANNVVRKIDAAGIISTFAGNGRNDDWGDGGPATSASLSAPTGLVFDRNGSLVILDSGHGRLRMVDSTGTITAVAAVGRGSSSGMPTNAPTQIPAGP